jgi:hypothetical protein
VAIAQEGLHSMKTKNIPMTIMKVDLEKDYYKVDWTYLWLLLLQMGMNIQIVNWIMGCLHSISFVVLIYGTPYGFFRASRGLRQGCSLSPFLFLLVV